MDGKFYALCSWTYVDECRKEISIMGNVSHRQFTKVKDAFDSRWLDTKEYSGKDWRMMEWNYRSTKEELFAIVWLDSGDRYFYVYSRAYKYLKIIAQALYGDFAYEGLGLKERYQLNI